MVQRKKNFTKPVRNHSLRDYFQDFCNNSSIHGIKYLGESGRPLRERLLWVIILIICFYVNGYLIQEVWNKWNDSPVIVSFAETPTPVWNVPFPAITICSEVKSRSTIFDFNHYMTIDLEDSNSTEEETKQKLGDVSLLCDSHVQVGGTEDYAGKRTIDFLMEVSPPFSETVWQCEWSDKNTSCSNLFTEILTQEGFCYTFNMLDKQDLLRGNPFPFLHPHGQKTTGWSLDGGYEHNAPLHAYPRRAFSAGAKAGLTIRMRARDEETDFYCRGPVLGFKVLLHNPAEIPLVRERYLRSPLNQDVVVVVQPNIMGTSLGLKSYDPHRRQCFFPSERYLKFFKVYTQRNCELECLTNYTLKACKCVGIHMPRDNDTKFCGAGNKQCMITAEENLRSEEVAASYKGTSVTCDCLPACTSIQYNSENTQANFASANSVISDEDNTATNYKESRISIFFKEMQFTTSRRSELFGVVNFIAHCGGLLSLFCGISFLSILELIYYITFWIWGNIKTKNNEEKKKEDEKQTPETSDDDEMKDIALIDWKTNEIKKKGLSDYIPADSVKLHFQEYCRSTSIHGVRYFGEINRPIVERISWVFFFLVCMVCNAYLIQQVWKKWNDSPVIVAFAETATPVWNVPFPAVTICSEVKSRSTFFNFTEAMHSNEDDYLIKKQRGDVSLLCDDHVLCEGENYTDDSTMDFLMEAAPPFLDTIFLCKWNNLISQNCSDIFTRIVTDEGICYSFNMLDKQDLFRDDVITYFESDGLQVQGWSQDEGYTPDAQLETYPKRALYSGASGGLFIVLKANRYDADFYCKGPVQGFKILLHNPAEFPMVRERYLRVPIGQEVIAVVQPSIMTTSKNLRSYSPHQRHCYFPSERYLAFFKIYNQPNCEMECLTNYTLSRCGCVALHMPRKGDTKICGPGYKKCIVDAARNLRLSRIVSSDKYDITSCDCLPACTSTVYNAESSQADFAFLSVVNAYGDNVTEFEAYDASRTSIFFKDVQFTTSRRNELYGVVDFLANCGGLLGLFCGVSILSFVELLYYSTLRFWGNLRAFKQAKKKNEEI